MGIEWQVWAGSGLEEVGIGQNRLRNSSYEHFYVGCWSIKRITKSHFSRWTHTSTGHAERACN